LSAGADGYDRRGALSRLSAGADVYDRRGAPSRHSDGYSRAGSGSGSGSAGLPSPSASRFSAGAPGRERPPSALRRSITPDTGLAHARDYGLLTREHAERDALGAWLPGDRAALRPTLSDLTTSRSSASRARTPERPSPSARTHSRGASTPLTSLSALSDGGDELARALKARDAAYDAERAALLRALMDAQAVNRALADKNARLNARLDVLEGVVAEMEEARAADARSERECAADAAAARERERRAEETPRERMPARGAWPEGDVEREYEQQSRRQAADVPRLAPAPAPRGGSRQASQPALRHSASPIARPRFGSPAPLPAPDGRFVDADSDADSASVSGTSDEPTERHGLARAAPARQRPHSRGSSSAASVFAPPSVDMSMLLHERGAEHMSPPSPTLSRASGHAPPPARPWPTSPAPSASTGAETSLRTGSPGSLRLRPEHAHLLDDLDVRSFELEGEDVDEFGL
jgi:hypothetical protein